jgi:hypothetical protein
MAQSLGKHIFALTRWPAAKCNRTPEAPAAGLHASKEDLTTLAK